MNLNHAWLWKQHCDVADKFRTEFKYDNPNTDELWMGGNSSQTTDMYTPLKVGSDFERNILQAIIFTFCFAFRENLF